MAGRLAMLACALLLCACAHHPEAASPAHSSSGIPFAGLSVAQVEGGALVTDIVAGPADAAGLFRGDLIVAADGEPMTAARFLERLQSSAPGTVMQLRVLRGQDTRDARLVVGDILDWTSPSQRPARAAFEPRPRIGTVWLDEIEPRLVAAAPEVQPVKARIDAMLREMAVQPRGPNRSRINREALADPGTLISWERRMAQALDPAANGPAKASRAFCETLDLACDVLAGSPNAIGLQAFAAEIGGVNATVRGVFPAAGRRQLLADARVLLEETARRRTLLDRGKAPAGLRAMRASEQVDAAALLSAFDRLLANALRAPRMPERRTQRVPSALSAMVKGEILDFVGLDGGYVVVGGSGPNVYRMDRLYAVIDIGGDDRYTWREGLATETQTVVDLGGNDRYEADSGGPGAGWLGAAVLLDLEGDDRYVAALGGCGAGIYGFGLLFDAAGNDAYRCEAWSNGAGLYGGGMLIDAAGGDAYDSHSLSQGVGGPGGVGLLVDGAGNDFYRANGPVPSAYETPAVFMSFSQGVGFGIRPYDHGGFGALLDYGGDDRYEGGEFSQGGGYFHGVGLLHDAAGNDFYYGNRYAQGFACHQAAGLLSDLAGDDVYWSMTAAGQGAAWDQSAAMLFDGAGNDVYRAESLSQGAAAQQSRAWLFDADGDDSYRSTMDSAQGAATDNDYHFRDDDPVLSLGVLVDAGGEDRYSTGLGNGESRLRFAPGAGKGRGNAGLAMDLAP